MFFPSLEWGAKVHGKTGWGAMAGLAPPGYNTIEINNEKAVGHSLYASVNSCSQRSYSSYI